MSTYTYIHTQIRDRQTMHRVLASIPGATVEPNAVIPSKYGGYLNVAFRVTVRNEAISAQSFFSSLFQGGVREFWVYEGDDGTMYIEISHDVGAQRQVADAVTNALSRQEQQAQEQEQRRQRELQRKQEQQRQMEQRRQRELQRQRELEEQRLKAEAEQRRFAEQERARAEAEAQELAERQAEQQRLAEEAARQQAAAEAQREQQRQNAQLEALEILNRLNTASDPPTTNNASDATNDSSPSGQGEGGAELLSNLNDAIAQEYSRQLVMEKIEEIKTIYGINLKEINEMEDGSIEIRLQG